MVSAAGRSNAPGNDCPQGRIDGDRPCTSSPSAATPGSGAQNDLLPLLPPLLQPTQVRAPCHGGADLPKHTYGMPDFDFKNILVIVFREIRDSKSQFCPKSVSADTREI